MPDLTIHAGVCGFVTTIHAASEDQQNVSLTFETTCPHLAKAAGELTTVDAYTDIFRKPHETTVYAVLSKYLVHTACPLYSGFFKAVEAAAGLALPRDVAMSFEETSYKQKEQNP
jgi:hypothetical protein